MLSSIIEDDLFGDQQSPDMNEKRQETAAHHKTELHGKRPNALKNRWYVSHHHFGTEEKE
jgi:hypothetical protein